MKRITYWRDIEDPLDRFQAKLVWDEEAWQCQCDQDAQIADTLEMFGDNRHLAGDYSEVERLWEKQYASNES